ncbi:MAG TPA: SRPBCC family protein [Ktedonobacterales bacterium]|jgi:uncharacterized membrane protein|nr:SRPBCC family protein [Ktedonobacterales bacterium]
MFTVDKSIIVDAPIEQVFAYTVDPVLEPEYMTGTDEVKDIQRLPDGRYTYTAVSKFLGLHMDFKCEQTEVVPNERIVEKMRGAGLDGMSIERLEPLEGGKTRVTIHSEGSLHAGPLAKFGESFMERYMDHGMEMAMHAAKAHIEARTPAAKAH